MTQERLGIADIIGNKRKAILDLAAQYGAANLRVFGSVARGEALPESDVDFLVDFPNGYRLLHHSGLQHELQTLLGRRVDVTIASRLRDEFQNSILEDAVEL